MATFKISFTLTTLETNNYHAQVFTSAFNFKLCHKANYDIHNMSYTLPYLRSFAKF